MTGASSSASVRIAEVPAVVDVQPGVRDQRGLHPRVDDRDDRVVVAAHHQRRLPDQAAGTAGCSSRSSRRAGSSSRASAPTGWRRAAGRHRARGRCAWCRRRSRRRCWRRTPGRGGGAGSSIFASTRGWAGTISAAGAGGDQHHPAYPPPGLHGELLGEPAAPGQPEHVELAVAEPGHQRGHPGGQRRRSGRGTAAAGLPPTPGTSKRTTPRSGSRASTSGCSASRLDADPVAQQQRRLVRRAAPRPGRTETRAWMPAHGDGADPVAAVSASRRSLSGHGHRCRGRRRSARTPRSPSRRGLLRSAPVRSASHST